MSEKACAGCGTANEADARFCEGCGIALERRCAACGTAASATARFCKSCGGSLNGPIAEPAPAAPTRKTVTVLFADLAGSTTFEEQVDAETAREVMGQYHSLLRETADRHRAGVTKYIGDGFMAVWGVPEISATDADHAVDAALELQDRFVGLAVQVAATHGEDLALRVAVNTGEVVVGAQDADLVGDALNVAARLESQCPHGHVVVGEETWRSTRGRYRYDPLTPVQVKGRAAPVTVYRLAGRRSEPADSVPFVGRTHEFRRLQTVLDDAAASRVARLVTVIGDPGVGKTRLAAEFAGSQRDAVVLQIRCAAEGTVALAPVVEVLRGRELDDDLTPTVPERDRILRDLNGMTGGVAGSVEETFWALRRYFEVLAADGRLILVLDDIHWADALLLDFVEHLSEWVREAPILMIALARPELRETRPELVSVGEWVGDAIRLGGLEPGATAELAARVVGSGQLPTELLARLPASTGGNPLFVRELVAMLVHDGVLVAEPEGWRLTIDVDAIAVPPTIQGLLASRLERLPTGDRRVLEVASALGTDFSPAAVSALTGASPAEVKVSLERLRRLELVQHSGTYAGDEPVWRFHHVLIRDVAYRRLLKSDRADLHERFADWIQGGGQAGVFESDELVARHLESAYGYRCELGVRDAGAAELALRAARCYLSAARRALDRDALVSAGAQAARGAALAAADPALRAELLLVGCEAFLSAGDVTAGAPLVDQLNNMADNALAPWATCYRCQYIVYTDPSRLLEVDERLQDAIDQFARRGDPAGSAKAYRVRAAARGRLGRIGDAEADLFEALIAARKCGDHRQITAALGAAPNAALWGPSPAPKAGGRCLDVVRMQRMTTAAPSLEATSLRCLAVLELLRGRPDKARSMLADARGIVSELGLRHGLMETELYAGIIESMAGDPVAAEPHFRTALEGLDSLGVGADAGQAAALLARSLLAQGRIDEADRYAAESERIAGHNLKTAIGWRAARAEILSAQWRHREAVAMAQDAVEVAAETDLVLDYADACLTLSRVLAATGDMPNAAEAQHRAESLYAAKDAVFLVDTAPQSAAPAAAAPTAGKAARLVVVNRACEVLLAGWQSLKLEYAEGLVYEDHRKVSGEPLRGADDFIAAAQRKQEQYPHVETTVIAVRGQTVAFLSLRWWDDAGNETVSHDVYEIDGSDRLAYHGRFDRDDHVGAYRALEERYYAGEGKAFAVNGLKVLAFEEAFFTLDLEAARETVQPEFRWCAADSALKPGDRTLDELFAWRAERLTQVAAFRDWLAAQRWLSTDVCISLCEIQATGHDGEDYRWNRLYVAEYRDGLSFLVREFDITDEDAAFAYAESLVARENRRLVVRNRASAVADGIIAALRTGDGAAAAALHAEGLGYDDRRRLGGNSVTSRRDYLRSVEQLLRNYSRFEDQTLVVRGDRYALVSSRMSDSAGNSAAYLHVFELDDRGLIAYEGRFDEDDFLSAYLTLEERYYQGEGAPFASNGVKLLAFEKAFLSQDLEAARPLARPDFVWLADPATMKPGEQSLEEIFAWRADRLTQVAAFRDWLAAQRWLSTDVCISLCEIQATGHDGEDYRWNRLYVAEYRDGLSLLVREFDITDEDAAFAYAESLVARENRRLVVRNRASAVADGLIAALSAQDSSAAAALFAGQLTYDDRRRMGGNPVTSRQDYLRSAERLVQQYIHFESQTLAVRGDRTALMSSRLSDPSGNETAYLHVFELDDQGLILYEGRFDEDDFTGAYRVLEERYYAGEGAAFAVGGLTQLGFQEAIWAQDVEAARPLVRPGFVWEADPSTLKPGKRSLDEMFTWRAERLGQVGSFEDWLAVLHWLSPEVCVLRAEMNGEDYSWPRIYVTHGRNGLLVSGREFDVADEAEAFAYAESLVARGHSRLVLANRASVVADGIIAALRAGDRAAAAGFYAETFSYEDRRRLTGNPFGSCVAVEENAARVLSQYSDFESRTLAVRGERAALVSSRWSDPGGNQTAYLHVFELDDQGLISYEGRFDEDDFLGAYAELDRRYYAGEGVEFADSGLATAGWIEGIGRQDIDMVRRFSTPDFRWIAAPSSLKVPERTVEDMFDWLHGRGEQVTSQRHWQTVIRWVSPACGLGLVEVSAVGPEGDEYRWNYIVAAQVRDGRVAWIREFDTEDEAFEYAESVAAERPSRLAIANRASAVSGRILAEMRASHPDAAAAHWAESFVYDDRRAMSGEPIATQAEMRDALERIMIQYDRFHSRTIAVRGERITLQWLCWSDSEGNQSPTLDLAELGDDDRVIYEGRFDENDFETAYLELERRYYEGEGAAFAEAAAAMTELVTAGNRGDHDKVFELFEPRLQVESRSRTIIPNRTLDELRSSADEYKAMVRSSRIWNAAVRWLSPTCAVVRQEREAVGFEGQEFEWSRIYVVEIHGGRFTAGCEFDVEFEDEAFAYAFERMRVSASRLAVKNRASMIGDLLADAIRVGDIDRAVDFFPTEVEYVDRRRLSGDPVLGPAARRAAIQRVMKHFNKLDMAHIAVRGDHLMLAKCRRSDNAGNESVVLVLGQINTDDRFAAYIVFDEDEFDTAYSELDRRYYAGEGTASALAGQQLTDFVNAINRGELDSAFRLINNPDLRIETRSRALFPDRSTAELREDLANLLSMTSSVRWWYSDMRWLSPTVCVGRQEREAIGTGGESYAWTDIYAFEWHGDVVTWLCRFNLEDEEQAFAAAEERMLLSPSRLAVSNRASEVRYACTEAIQAGDIDQAADLYSDELQYQDHRPLSGDLPVGRSGMRAAFTRLRHDYNHFGGRFLAIRGDRLALGEYVCSDDSGNKTEGLSLTEIDQDGRIVFEARFGEDDFDFAYAELQRRYYESDGASFGDYGTTMADYFATKNRGDLDKLFGELTAPDMRIESRSRSVFSVRTAAEHRASMEGLARLVRSARDWTSAVHHVSPTWGVARYQREAVGLGGEDYQWERIVVVEIRSRRLHFVCEFEIDDEEAAFAYAEERAQASATRLPLTNQAHEAMAAIMRALSARDVNQIDAAYRDDARIENLMRWVGDGMVLSKAQLLQNVNQILTQYNHFDWNTLAVRGQRLVLGGTKWSDDAGNRSSTLHVVETDDDGRITRHSWFDEDDFDSARHELDRRFFKGDGAAFAVHEAVQDAFMDAVNRTDLAAARKVCLPSFRVQSPPTTLAVEERSLKEFFRWLSERAAQAPSVRHWMSAVSWLSDGCGVSRIEIEAIGRDGDEYSWPRLSVVEVRGGLLAYIRQFDVDDEESAFTYAEEILARHASRLPSTNQSSDTAVALVAAFQVADVEAVVDCYAEGYVFDDWRRLFGDPVRGEAALRAATEGILEQFDTFGCRALAVRGDRLSMGWTRWSDSAGNETCYLHVVETGDDGRIIYAARFDEDDFETAYAELERRYYAGEGAAFAEAGLLTAHYIATMNRGDFDAMFELTWPDFQIENFSRSAFPARSAAELRKSLEDLYAALAEVRSWCPQINWVSPTIWVARMEREAVGLDGEPFEWSRTLVGIWRDGKLASLCDFDPDDEDAAFAHAETLIE